MPHAMPIAIRAVAGPALRGVARARLLELAGKLEDVQLRAGYLEGVAENAALLALAAASGVDFIVELDQHGVWIDEGQTVGDGCADDAPSTRCLQTTRRPSRPRIAFQRTASHREPPYEMVGQVYQLFALTRRLRPRNGPMGLPERGRFTP